MVQGGCVLVAATRGGSGWGNEALPWSRGTLRLCACTQAGRSWSAGVRGDAVTGTVKTPASAPPRCSGAPLPDPPFPAVLVALVRSRWTPTQWCWVSVFFNPAGGRGLLVLLSNELEEEAF